MNVSYTFYVFYVLVHLLRVIYVLLPAESVCRRPSHAYQEGAPKTEPPPKTGVAAPAHMTATARGAASATTQCARRGEITAVTPSDGRMGEGS